jgi:hypothetical protein
VTIKPNNLIHTL